MLNRIVIQKIAIVFIAMFSLNLVYAEEFVNLLTTSTDTVYFSNFETNDGGLMDSTSSPGSWRREWGWGNPTYVNPPEGYFCWGTAIQGDEKLEDYNHLYLKTPMIKAKKAKLTFDSYFDDYQNDMAYIQFRTPSSGWTELQSYNSDHNWTNLTFDTPEMASDSIQFRFYMYKDNGNNYTRGWYIDNLSMEVYQTSIMHEEHPDTYNPYGPYKIIAELSDAVSWVGNLHIVYSIDGGSYVDNNMTQDGSKWEYMFDGQAVGTEIAYYFYSIDADANVHYLKRTGVDDFSFSVLENEGGYGFNLYQPANFSEDVDIYVLMKWTDLGDPDSRYTIQYGTDIDFTPGSYVEKSGMTETEIYNPVDFIKNEIYYWRVFAINTLSQDTVWANNGEKWVFEVIPPEMPSVVSGAVPIPANRTIIPENNPYFVQGDASNYEGDTLTVRAGVICEFTPGSSFDLNGHLISDGTETERITFRGEGDNSWDGIMFNQSSPVLELTSDFEFIVGPKFAYCDFDKGFLNDNGFTGVYIENCNFTESSNTNRIGWGFVNKSNFINGSGHGLEVSPLEDNWIISNSVMVNNTEFISNSSHGIYFDYIDNIFVNLSTANFNNSNGASANVYNHFVVDSSIFVENSKGIYANSGNAIKVNYCTLNENSSDGFNETTTVDSVEFTHNMVSNNVGIGFYGASENVKTIDENTFFSNNTGYYGIGLHFMTNNQFTENGPNGAVFIDGYSLGGHIISNNHIMFNENTVNGYYATGINLYRVNNAIVEDNIISNNYKFCTGNFWTGTSEQGRHGASLSALNIFGSNNTVINNIVTDNSTTINTHEAWTWGYTNSNDWNRNTNKNHGAGVSIIGNGNTLKYNNISNNSAFASVDYSSNTTVFLSGGGIYGWGDDLTITGNIIENNSIKADQTHNNNSAYASAYGAGIYIEGYFMREFNYFDYNRYSYTKIDSNIIRNNKIIDAENYNFYAKGAGIYTKPNGSIPNYTAHTDILHNEISGNSFIVENTSGTIYQEGVGVYSIDNGGRSRISNNTIVGNTSEHGHGGGVFASVNIDSCTISQNLSQYGGGIYFQDIADLPIYKVDYSTITLNTARLDYGAIYNPTEVTRSIIVGNKVIDNGEFNESATGGIASPNSNQSLTDIHYSNLYDNTGYDLRLDSGNLTNIDAEYTWWNSRSDQILIKDEIWDGFDDPGNLGIVNYQPFLTFASDQTPGQIEDYISIELYTDNTYQMLLGETVNLDQRFFIEMEVEDGNENSVDMSAVRIENLRNGDFIGPVVVETNLHTGIFRGSGVTADVTNFVFDSLRVEQGDSIRISPYNFPNINTVLVVDTTAVEFMLGDANNDEVVDVIDVMNIIYYILGATDQINFYSADVNSDSYINVIDIIGVVNIILGNPLQRECVVENLDVNMPKNYTLDDDETVIPIDISWSNGNVGGVEVIIETQNAEILDIYTDIEDANVFYNAIDDTKTKCIIVSLDDNIIDAENYFQIFVNLQTENEQAYLSINDMIISDQFGNEIETMLNNDETELFVLPDNFNLGQNYPNPFNPTTEIRLELPSNVIADIAVFNIRGQVVRDIMTSKELSGGYHTIVWDGKDNVGNEVTSGVYFFKFISQEYSVSRKMTVLR